MNEPLRQAMSQKGLSVEALAEKTGLDPKTVGRWLTAGRVPHPRNRALAATALGVEADEIWPGQGGRRRDVPWFKPWREVEAAAVCLRSWQTAVIPGLLQTEEYARAVLTSGPLMGDDVDRFVKIRLERQRAVFARPRPPLTLFVIDEAAIRRGPRALMDDQLDHMVQMARHPNVFVQILPEDAGLHPGQAGPFVIATLEGSSDVVYLDDQASGHVRTEVEEVAPLVMVWDAVRGYALPRDPSIEFMKVRPWRK